MRCRAPSETGGGRSLAAISGGFLSLSFLGFFLFCESKKAPLLNEWPSLFSSLSKTRETGVVPPSLSRSHTRILSPHSTAMATCGFCGGTASACGGALGPMIEVVAPPPTADVGRDNVVVPLIALSAPDVVHRHCALWSGEVRSRRLFFVVAAWCMKGAKGRE